MPGNIFFVCLAKLLSLETCCDAPGNLFGGIKEMMVGMFQGIKESFKTME